MAAVFPGTEYVVSTGSVICEFRNGKNHVSVRAEFEVSIDPEVAAAAVAEYWQGRDDTANIGAGFDTASGSADDSVISFIAYGNGVGLISVQGGPCRGGAVPATSVVVTPDDG